MFVNKYIAQDETKNDLELKVMWYESKLLAAEKTLEYLESLHASVQEVSQFVANKVIPKELEKAILSEENKHYNLVLQQLDIVNSFKSSIITANDAILNIQGDKTLFDETDKGSETDEEDSETDKDGLQASDELMIVFEKMNNVKVSDKDDLLNKKLVLLSFLDLLVGEIDEIVG